MKILVTGSSGLIGSEAVLHFDALDHEVFGIDNNMRKEFFGAKGDTSWNLRRLQEKARRFRHFPLDIRNREEIVSLFKANRFDMIIHCAAQPSHDKAREIPLVDFDVNAVGTINLLEATRQTCPEAVFIHMSTNKVYGDTPNRLPLAETPTRFDYSRPEDYKGIDESMSIDQSLHSLFGASKASGDLIAQEYGRYFKMNVGIFRGGCLTGPSHAGVELHGFLSYLIHVGVHAKHYTVFGYKGKQVRDQIHSFDVIRAFEEFARSPKQGEVYNIGGGRENAASVLECLELFRKLTGKDISWSYDERNRIGDHICYITDLQKLKHDYPRWSITRSLESIFIEMIDAEEAQRKNLR